MSGIWSFGKESGERGPCPVAIQDDHHMACIRKNMRGRWNNGLSRVTVALQNRGNRVITGQGLATSQRELPTTLPCIMDLRDTKSTLLPPDRTTTTALTNMWNAIQCPLTKTPSPHLDLYIPSLTTHRTASA